LCLDKVIPGIERCDRAGYEKREGKDEHNIPAGRQGGKKEGRKEGGTAMKEERCRGRKDGQGKKMKEGWREGRNKLTLKVSTPLGHVAPL
jgi:hypothetical protein